jgi:hypothetical protein
MSIKSEMKIAVGAGLVIHFKGSFEEVQQLADVLATTMKEGETKSYIVVGDGDFKVYYDKDKWNVIET